MFVWLNCLSAVSLQTAPFMACWVQEEVRSETSNPAENDPTEVIDDDVVLSRIHGTNCEECDVYHLARE